MIKDVCKCVSYAAGAFGAHLVAKTIATHFQGGADNFVQPHCSVSVSDILGGLESYSLRVGRGGGLRKSVRFLLRYPAGCAHG